MDARYALWVRFRPEPTSPDVTLDPATFEASLYREADEPGTEGWLFFRDNLWRGELNDPDHARTLVEETIDVPVDAVEFRALHTDEPYFDAFTDEIAANLDLFRADDATEVISKYLGSSIVVEDGSR